MQLGLYLLRVVKLCHYLSDIRSKPDEKRLLQLFKCGFYLHYLSYLLLMINS